MSRHNQIWLFAAAFIMLGAGASAQTAYKEFKRSVTLDPYFTISGDNKGNIRVTAPELASPVAIQFAPGDTTKAQDVFSPGPGLTVWEDSLKAGDRVFEFVRIVDVDISRSGDTTIVQFLTSSDTTRAAMRLKQGNIIRGLSAVHVPANQFVRGHVVAIGGDVTIAGEINKEVISIFGTVDIDRGAVVRGSVVSLAKTVTVRPQSTVYGRVMSPRQKLAFGRQLWSRDREFRIDPDIRYNRVDGLDLFLGFAFQDHDSILPSIWAKGGYAFESERWRYRFGVEQTLKRAPALTLGGEAFRTLASDDDWLLSDYENLAYVVLAREDFKDYYEAEGGSIDVKFSPIHRLKIDAQFRVEDTKWLDAHPRLWAIFGGHKRFRDNFSTIEPAARAVGKQDIDGKTVAGPVFAANYDTRSTQGIFDSSGWAISGQLEWSLKDWNSDYDYRRYTIGVTRYQRIRRESILLMRAMLANSDGYLPIHKRYYLGGLGTLQGYGHKEYSGSRFWMVNSEYRVTIPGSDIALSALWDVGQIADNSPLNGSVEVKHSIGLAGYIGSGFRLSVSKRLDRSANDSPEFYVRLTHPF